MGVPIVQMGWHLERLSVHLPLLTLLSVQIFLLLPHGCDWLNVSSGTGLPGQRAIKGLRAFVCIPTES